MKQIEKRTCPKCGREYRGVPALSREDNKTLICSDCGTLESLDIFGLSDEDKAKIIETIHKAVVGTN